MPALDLVPVARNPLAARGRFAPDAADPKEIVARLVPAPIARYPLDILPSRFLVGRDFLDRPGGSLGMTGPAAGS